MKKLVAIILAVSFSSGLFAVELEKVTFTDRVKNCYQSVKSKMPELNKKNLQIASITTAGIAALSGVGYGTHRYLRTRNVAKIVE